MKTLKYLIIISLTIVNIVDISAIDPNAALEKANQARKVGKKLLKGIMGESEGDKFCREQFNKIGDEGGPADETAWSRLKCKGHFMSGKCYKKNADEVKCKVL